MQCKLHEGADERIIAGQVTAADVDEALRREPLHLLDGKRNGARNACSCSSTMAEQVSHESAAGTTGFGFEVQDPHKFAQNMTRLLEETAKAVTAYVEPRLNNPAQAFASGDFARMINAFSKIQGAWLAHPQKFMLVGHVGGEDVLLARRGDEIFAVGAHCTHYHGPLAEGLLVAGTVRCPWHHARFDLSTGEAIGAPAFDALSCWEV